MIIWVLYDIKKDSSRNMTAKICKQAGLYRVQYSVFVGTLDLNEKDNLKLKLEELIDEKTDKVYIFPMNKTEMQETVLLGQAFDKNLVSDKVKELFF